VEIDAGALHGDQESRTEGANFSAPGFGSANGVAFNTGITGGNGTQWAVLARQPLIDAANRADARQLRHGGDLAEAQLTQARAELALRVARAYFDVLIAADAERTLRQQAEAAERAAAEASERFDAGDLPVTDSLEAQARLDATRARLVDAQGELELKRAAFTDITQLPASALVGLDADAPLAAATPAPVEQWLSQAEAGSPLLAMQRIAADMARDRIDQHRALSAPRLALVAQASGQQAHGTGDYGVARNSTASRTIGLQLSIPVFTGGMRGARYDEAVADADQAGFELERTRQAVAQQTRRAWLGVSQGAARIASLAQARRSAHSRLDATQLGVEAGARTTLDLVNAQSDALAADAAWSRARYEWLFSRLQLAAAAGDASEEQIAEISAALRSPPAAQQ
jgi:outer membrane protein